MHWRPEGLWQGYAGLALLSATLDEIAPNDGWDLVGRDQIRSAAAGLERRTDSGGGFAGGGRRCRGGGGGAFARGRPVPDPAAHARRDPC